MKFLLLKKLSSTKKSISGRNNYGRITVYHRGGRGKLHYRLVDFTITIKEIPGHVKTIEYDPNRTAFIALIYFLNGILIYKIASEGMQNDSIIINSLKAIQHGSLFPGNGYLLKNYKLGSIIHLISKNFNSQAILARAAGSYAILLRRSLFFAFVKLSSGKEYKVSINSFASHGRVSNAEHHFKKKKKAGQSRWLGIRPTVRGEAKNPVDHPHGGRTRGGRSDVTPWGFIKKGSKKKKKKKFI